MSELLFLVYLLGKRDALKGVDRTDAELRVSFEALALVGNLPTPQSKFQELQLIRNFDKFISLCQQVRES